MTPRILIVEDERHIGIGLKYNCEAEGYEATLVGDGPAALALIREDHSRFDLIILDLMLPGMSGYAVLESIRQAAIQTPVLILSARTLSEDRTRGFDLGADQYLMKPFELKELLSRVRNLLARRSVLPTPQAEEDQYAFESHHLNFTRHEALIHGEPRNLTPLEFELLRCLIRSEGKVLTRAQLLDRVWGVDSLSTTRTVDNFILRLRKYFEVDPARPRHFLSVRGVGYRFVKAPEPQPESEPTEEADETSGP